MHSCGTVEMTPIESVLRSAFQKNSLCEQVGVVVQTDPGRSGGTSTDVV